MNGEKGKLICVWQATHISLHYSTPALRHHFPRVLRGSKSHCQSVPYLLRVLVNPCCLPAALNHSVPLQATPLIDLSRGAASANVDSTRRGRATRAAGGGRLAEAPENNTPPRFPWHKKQSHPPAPVTEQTSAKLVSDSNPKERRASRKPVEWRGTKHLFFFFCLCTVHLPPRESEFQLPSLITRCLDSKPGEFRFMKSTVATQNTFPKTVIF